MEIIFLFIPSVLDPCLIFNRGPISDWYKLNQWYWCKTFEYCYKTHSSTTRRKRLDSYNKPDHEGHEEMQ